MSVMLRSYVFTRTRGFDAFTTNTDVFLRLPFQQRHGFFYFLLTHKQTQQGLFFYSRSHEGEPSNFRARRAGALAETTNSLGDAGSNHPNGPTQLIASSQHVTVDGPNGSAHSEMDPTCHAQGFTTTQPTPPNPTAIH